MDDCEEVVRQFTVKKVPTVLFVRLKGPAARSKVGNPKQPNPPSKSVQQEFDQFDELAKFTRLGKHFPGEFRQAIAQYSSPQTQALRSSRATDTLARLTTTSTADSLDILARQPLRPLLRFVQSMKREELGLAPLGSTSAFNIDDHSAAQSGPAKKMLHHVRKDVAAYAQSTNARALVKVKQLSDVFIAAAFKSGSSADGVLSNALALVRELQFELKQLKEMDCAEVERGIATVQNAVNALPVRRVDHSSTQVAKRVFALSQKSRLRCPVSIDFIFGCLLSSRGEDDMQRLNEFLGPSTIRRVMLITAMCMLRTNRLGQINACITLAVKLDNLLQQVHMPL